MTKKISALHYSQDWPNDLADVNSQNWSKGIEIVKSRIESRYLLPVKALIENEDLMIKYNCGFLVMSADCLLIETLNQFFLGIYHSEEKYSKRNSDPNFKYNKQAFRDFFEYSAYFPQFKGNLPLINKFYDDIRCGLLHQAESKTNSLINLKEGQMIKYHDPNDLSQGIIVNRKLFHVALVDEFQKYLTDLANPASANLYGESLREKCNRKMSEICL